MRRAYHIEDMKATAKMSKDKLQQLGDKYDSIYLNKVQLMRSSMTFFKNLL